jgi:uncharacterized RDD family membrane protein YckC
MSSVPPAATPDDALGQRGQRVRGGRLGLPATGPGSIAPTGRRLGALIVDCLASALVAGLFTSSLPHRGGSSALPGSWSLIPFGLNYIIGLPLAGRTLGMNLFGLRVVRVDPPGRVSVLDAVVRTILLALLIPALIWDKDGRGLHDRLARTAVVLAGKPTKSGPSSG